MQRFLRSSHGGSTVELALTIPAAVLLIFGTINLALISFQTVRMQVAARDAARCVMIGRSCTGTNASVNSYAAARWVGIGTRPTFTWSGTGCGNTVTATVDPYKLFTGLGNISLKLATKASYPLQTTS